MRVFVCIHHLSSARGLWLTTEAIVHVVLPVGLFFIILQALKHYNDLADIKGIIVHTKILSPDVHQFPFV
jgi:hypothetical protein